MVKNCDKTFTQLESEGKTDYIESVYKVVHLATTKRFAEDLFSRFCKDEITARQATDFAYAMPRGSW